MTHALFITRAWPENPDQATHGIFQRMSLFIDALCNSFDQVEILAFAPGSATLLANAQIFESKLRDLHGEGIHINAQIRRPSPNPWPFFRRYLIPIVAIDRQDIYFNIGGAEHIAAVEAALDRNPSMVFAHRLHAFTPLWPGIRRLAAPLLFDMDDIEHRALTRTVIAKPLWPSERFRLLHVPAVVLRERSALRRSTASFVCSAGDATTLQRLAAVDTVHVVPNTVTVPNILAKSNPLGRSLGFIGSFAHPPNVDAVRWLLADIWPRIRLLIPDAQLRVAGSGSLKIFGPENGKNGVSVLDFVEDLAAFYQSVNVVIAPLRYGAGTRVKIIEAAGYAMPVVSTNLGAEGLAFAPETEIVLADDIATFSSRCAELLSCHEKATRIGLAARQCFKREYDRNSIVSKIELVISQALGKRTSLLSGPEI